MKKICFLTLVLALAAALFTAAQASPALTDGKVNAWIAENGYLCLQGEDGIIRQMPMEMADLLGISGDELICRAKDLRIIAVNRNGTGSRLYDSAEAQQPRGPEVKLEEGKLTLNGAEVSPAAGAFATDGTYLYYAEKTDETWYLRVKTLQESTLIMTLQGRDAAAAALSGKPIDEPASLTVTQEALTLTTKDHRVTVMSMVTGTAAEYPAVSDKTEAACVVNAVLYRYALAEDGSWVFESRLDTATPTPSPAPTPAPTPRPTAKPTDYIDEDGTVHLGASGSKVRKIQQRLLDLGYPTGKVDGKYGEQTQLAINLFCDAIHVREHNYITAKVQKRLFADDAPIYDPYLPLKKGDRGVSVLYMQRRLKELGYDPQKLDGIYGDMTVAAVAKFQVDYMITLEENEKPGEVASREMMEILFAPEPPTPTDLR